ncbi:MAG: NAD(P)/FAD-dependent oxidoreductase [Deinococcales bacterium]
MRVEVAIVGGGPVGLLLACLLAGAGVTVTVLERRAAPSRRSRSIGIHPPALEVLARADLAPAFLERGVRVVRGHAYAGRRYLGTLSFAACPPPYRFVLTLPQSDGERLLEARLGTVAPGALRRGVTVAAVHAGNGSVGLALAGGGTLEAALVVACDGHDSAVRRALAIPTRSRAHADRFVMGDFPDGTALGADAAIYLTEAGVVESFPLPGGRRRWVAAAAPGGGGDAPPATLAAWVRERLGERLDVDGCDMISAFGVRTLLARRLAAGRVVLAGDAAHVMPPFGGQGMNLGWLDAAALYAAITAARGGEDLSRVPSWELQRLLAGYESARLAAAYAAARRAEFNLALGRATRLAALRAGVVAAGLRSPLAGAFARRFSMRGLEAGVAGPPARAVAAAPHRQRRARGRRWADSARQARAGGDRGGEPGIESGIGMRR